MWEHLKKLRRFDAYPKTLEDVRIQTLGGGTSKQKLNFQMNFTNYHFSFTD